MTEVIKYQIANARDESIRLLEEVHSMNEQPPRWMVYIRSKAGKAMFIKHTGRLEVPFIAMVSNRLEPISGPKNKKLTEGSYIALFDSKEDASLDKSRVAQITDDPIEIIDVRDFLLYRARESQEIAKRLEEVLTSVQMEEEPDL